MNTTSQQDNNKTLTDLWDEENITLLIEKVQETLAQIVSLSQDPAFATYDFAVTFEILDNILYQLELELKRTGLGYLPLPNILQNVPELQCFPDIPEYKQVEYNTISSEESIAQKMIRELPATFLSPDKSFELSTPLSTATSQRMVTQQVAVNPLDVLIQTIVISRTQAEKQLDLTHGVGLDWMYDVLMYKLGELVTESKAVTRILKENSALQDNIFKAVGTEWSRYSK